MPVSSSAAKVARLGQIDCWIGLAGVAQSVAQLSCKQQVRSSSLLASSKSPVLLRLIVDFRVPVDVCRSSA